MATQNNNTNVMSSHKTTASKAPKKLVPQLRFPEFNHEWEKVRLKDVSQYFNGGSFENDVKKNGRYELVTLKSIDINGNLVSSQRFVDIEVETLNKNTLVMILSEQAPGLLGKTAIIPVNNKYVLNQRIAEIRPNNGINSCFLSMVINRNQKYFSKMGAGMKVQNISKPNVQNYIFHYTTIQEQQKIAQFLTAVDSKLQQLNQKKELLEQYKKGVMQQLFPSTGSGHVAQLRFKQDDGSDYPDWEEKKLGDVVERVTRKNKENNQNVLTISAQQGLINQEEYFNKSVSAKDVTGYYLLERDDFAYNKSYSKGYPLGAIKRLTKYNKGVVSTLYIIFKAKNKVAISFLEQLFEGGILNKELHKIAQEGARNHGLLNLSVTEFFNDIKLIIPLIEEQQKIASYLSAIDTKIDTVTQQIEATQQFKKGVLQQMFV